MSVEISNYLTVSHDTPKTMIMMMKGKIAKMHNESMSASDFDPLKVIVKVKNPFPILQSEHAIINEVNEGIYMGNYVTPALAQEWAVWSKPT